MQHRTKSQRIGTLIAASFGAESKLQSFGATQLASEISIAGKYSGHATIFRQVVDQPPRPHHPISHNLRAARTLTPTLAHPFGRAPNFFSKVNHARSISRVFILTKCSFAARLRYCFRCDHELDLGFRFRFFESFAYGTR